MLETYPFLLIWMYNGEKEKLTFAKKLAYTKLQNTLMIIILFYTTQENIFLVLCETLNMLNSWLDKLTSLEMSYGIHERWCCH